MKLRPRHLWFKQLLVLGLVLGFLLLIQSILTYYQVSRILVHSELKRDAQLIVATLERTAPLTNIGGPFCQFILGLL